MRNANGLGRVVVVDMGEGGRRVLRAIRELARLGRAEAAVAVHGREDRHAAFLRDADEGGSDDGPQGKHARYVRPRLTRAQARR